MFAQDLHLVKRDEPVQAARGVADRADDVRAGQEEDDGVDRQPDNDLTLHQLFQIFVCGEVQVDVFRVFQDERTPCSWSR